MKLSEIVDQEAFRNELQETLDAVLDKFDVSREELSLSFCLYDNQMLINLSNLDRGDSINFHHMVCQFEATRIAESN